MRTFVTEHVLSSTFVIALTLTGTPVHAEPTPLRATEPSATPLAPVAPPAAGMSQGKVLETMGATGYTYVRVGTEAGDKWIAGPQTSVKVGDVVSWPAGTEMKNFQSKTLGRTFDSILFADQLVVAAPGAGAATPHAALSGKAAEGPEIAGIVKADGGVTVAEVYDRRAELDGTEVAVRGKVVKFNADVMGRNWLHLRDGTKTTGGDNDLTVTGDGTAAVGDTVLVRGKVVLNKDFGFNYRYDVMLENAKIVVE
ncbi:MAG: hypothetical protein ABR587_06745 [Candidatus Binatia bacterium]